MSPETEVPRNPETAPRLRTHRFLVDTIWIWASVIANLLTGLLLSPYIIRKLGAEGYGLWSLVFSIVGYYTVMDLGFRSAVITMTAEYEARGERDKIGVLLSTTFVYSFALTIVLLIVSMVLAYGAADWFHVSDAYHRPFQISIALAGFVLSVAFTFNLINGCLEGLQRFQGLNQLRTSLLLIRALGSASLLAAGFGLVALTLVSIVTSMIAFVGYWLMLKRALPGLHLGRQLVKLSVLKEAASYGFHTTVAGVGQVLIEQTPSVLIGRMVSPAAVGFYSLPFRVLQYPAEMVTRVTLMLAPIAAEFGAKERSDALANVAVLANRYSLVLYGPFALILMTWGTDILRLWVGAEYARESGPLLIYFVIGTWLAVAGQSSSVSLLFGLRAHQWYAAGLVVEGLFLAGGILLFAHQGLVFAAMVTCAAMLVDRGIWAPWLVCKRLGRGLASYMWGIYSRPLILAAPVYLGLYELHERTQLKATWPLVLAISVATGLSYYALAYVWCVAPEHRKMGIALLKQARVRVLG